MYRLPHRYLLNTDFVRAHIDSNNENQKSAAARIGLSKSYLSQLLNRRRSLTPAVRKKIRGCGLFEGVSDELLWERVPLGQVSPPKAI